VSGSGIGEISSSILPSVGNDISDVFGESPLGPKDAYVYNYFENEASTTSDTNTIVGITLPTQNFTYEASAASTPWLNHN
jgi:hypothetical protein